MTETVAPETDEDARGLIPVLTSVIRRRWTSSVFGIVAPGAVRRRPSDIGRVITAVVVIAGDLGERPGGHQPRGPGVRPRGRPAGGPDGALRGALPPRRGRRRHPRPQRPHRPAGPSAPHPPPRLRRRVGRRRRACPASSTSPRPSKRPERTSAATTRTSRSCPWRRPSPCSSPPARTSPARPDAWSRSCSGSRPSPRCTWPRACPSRSWPASCCPGAQRRWPTSPWGHRGARPPSGRSRPRCATSAWPTTASSSRQEQTWGHTAYTSEVDDRLAVEVVGRDSTDARLFAKIWRSVWYKDAGPTLSLRRGQQVEHQALTLLLADRTGARVPDLVAVGIAGARDDAVLVVRNPPGRTLGDLDPDGDRRRRAR